MGSFACEIVEEKDELSSAKRLNKDLEHPILKLGYRGSLEDDIDKLFQSLSLKASSKVLGPSHHATGSTSASTSRSTSPLKRNAMKKPLTVGTPRSPRVGTSEPVSLKQALRDHCISKASEMAAQKRLSKSTTASPRISEAEKIKSLYNHVLVESARRSGINIDKGKESVIPVSLPPEERKPISFESMPRQILVLKTKSSSKIAEISPDYSDPATQIAKESLPEEKVIGSASSEVRIQKLKSAMSEKPNESTYSPSYSNGEDKVLELNKNVGSSTKSANKLGAPKSGRNWRLHNTDSSGSNTSRRVGKSTRNVPRAKPMPKKRVILKRKIKLGLAPVAYPANKSDAVDRFFNPTADQLFCQRCHCALKSTSSETNPSLYPIDGAEIGPPNLKSGVRNAGKEADRDLFTFPRVKDITEVGSDTVNLVMKKANKESKKDSLSTEVSCIVKSAIRKQNNYIKNGAAFEKQKENPTSSEIGEFSHSSKDSLGEYSSTTSMSEDSNLSRFSCGYKPHMSKDVKWEAIKHVKMQHGMLGLRHFNLLKKLGCGDIGTVYLAELIGTNCLFAIKVMDNEFLARRKKLPRAQTERDILRMLDHPFLPTLYAQFTSDNLSCLVMEYCPGGDLHVLRQKQLGRRFPEPAARFYVAEVLLALEYLHMLGVVYRDLKPENILVREDGHIMLTDFDLSLRCSVHPTLERSSSPPNEDPARTSGPYNTSSCMEPFCTGPSGRVPCFSPRLSSTDTKAKIRKPKRPDYLSQQFRSLPQLVAEPTDARSNSFVGTHEYLAPEIIKGEGHGAAVDWWTFGILLYELLYGRTPFKGCNNDETLANVVLHNLVFPDSPLVSTQARDLIRGLLVKEPENRLGSEKGAAEIKRHPFFEGLNWALIRCAIPPELPGFYDSEVQEMVWPESNGKYLECKAIGEHLEFELF